MLCSAIELGLGTDADGIHILGHGDEIALGTPLAEVVGETVLDVDVKPNRGDALCMVGPGARDRRVHRRPSCGCPTRRVDRGR